MINKKMSDSQVSLLYMLAVLLVTWIFTFLIFAKSAVGLITLAWIMFFPAIVAIIFNMLGRKSFRSMFSCVTAKPNLKSMVFGIGYPLLFIAICAIAALLTGSGYFNPASLNGSSFAAVLITSIILILVNLIPAFGEEYGWRGYLLPRLTRSMGKTTATIIVGIAWALFHFPIVYLLASTTGIGNPLLVAVVQACAAFLFSFSFSYSYYLSGSIIPVMFYHSTWNVVNTLILGDIYFKNLGLVAGNIPYINGEGLFGVILGIILAAWFIYQFKKSDKYSNRV